MKACDLVIQNVTGLHARPAREFVNVAKQFKAKIQVQHGEKKVNAKSLISILALGVRSGGTIRVEADGVDEMEAMVALETAVSSGLGENHHHQEPSSNGHPKPAPAPVAPAAVAPAADNLITGLPAAPGIAIGPIFQFTKQTVAVRQTFAGAEAEKATLTTALTTAQAQLATLRDQMAAQAADEAAIFDVHRDILDDPELEEMVHAAIENEQSAAQAWQSSVEARAMIMAGLDDPLLAARAADLRDVGERVLRILAGDEATGASLPGHPIILIAHDLSPSDTAALDKEKVLGICTAAGGPTAHAAIIARALGLPAVVSAGEKVLTLAGETAVILNGHSGTLTLNPDEATLAAARAAQEQEQARRKAAVAAAADPAITQDGHRVEVVANIGSVADAQQAYAAGAEGVGLLRTEFLFMDRDEAPSEEEQFAVYRDIAQALHNQPVIVRTLDIGGDKPLPYINVPHEENPFLGERGIRLCLNRPDLLRQQLRAILRAASHGTLRIMFPMVADLGEWHAAKQIVKEVQKEVGGETAVSLGIMIEIPAAALMADAFAPEVDFFSVGTNDLTQYTLAMDRMHPTLAKQADGLHPAILRLIHTTTKAAHRAGKWVGVCGELGADPQALPILLGLGVDELSVNVPALATVKAQIRGLQLADARTLAQQALQCRTAAEVRALKI
ncbi:MAG: phosphoenolpyruvate--protein phosphotransferase [Anaerolineales bacterium]|nr:phosphoenolpyruvate--protein phosphotransferase [Anaerolineales bacterium]